MVPIRDRSRVLGVHVDDHAEVGCARRLRHRVGHPAHRLGDVLRALRPHEHRPPRPAAYTMEDGGSEDARIREAGRELLGQASGDENDVALIGSVDHDPHEMPERREAVIPAPQDLAVHERGDVVPCAELDRPAARLPRLDEHRRGFAAAAGIVTAVGARTAHASLVARQMGKPCLVGCSAIQVDAVAQCARVGDNIILAGDWITVDGNEGRLYLGRCNIVLRRPEAELAELASWQGVQRPVPALS